ncbi:MAG: DUF6326 family protein [Deinococcota bacterium]
MVDIREKLSTLWILVLFNMGFADILGLYIPGTQEALVELAGATPVSQLMLGGAIMFQIPIAMVFFSRFLTRRPNCWSNIIAAVVTIAFIIGGGSLKPHYILIATIEVFVLLVIIWHAWRWSKPNLAPKFA